MARRMEQTLYLHVKCLFHPNTLLTRSQKIIVDVEKPTRLLLAESVEIIKSVKNRTKMFHISVLLLTLVSSIWSKRRIQDTLCDILTRCRHLWLSDQRIHCDCRLWRVWFQRWHFCSSHVTCIDVLNSHTLLVSDIIFSIFSGENGNVDGYISSCSLSNPYGLLIFDQADVTVHG